MQSFEDNGGCFGLVGVLNIYFVKFLQITWQQFASNSCFTNKFFLVTIRTLISTCGRQFAVIKPLLQSVQFQKIKYQYHYSKYLYVLSFRVALLLLYFFFKFYLSTVPPTFSPPTLPQPSSLSPIHSWENVRPPTRSQQSLAHQTEISPSPSPLH